MTAKVNIIKNNIKIIKKHENDQMVNKDQGKDADCAGMEERGTISLRHPKARSGHP